MIFSEIINWKGKTHAKSEWPGIPDGIEGRELGDEKGSQVKVFSFLFFCHTIIYYDFIPPPPRLNKLYNQKYERDSTTASCFVKHNLTKTFNFF